MAAAAFSFGRSERLVATLFCIMMSGLAFSQSFPKTLNDIDQDYKLQLRLAATRINGYLKKHPQSRMTFVQNDAVHLLIDVNENGIPIYVKSDNAGVATSLNVQQLRTGGSLGINLTGAGIRLGTWESGRVHSNHVELTGRVTQMDGASVLDNHATHTSGTMIASGVNPLAKGMAPQAILSAFDFSNDVSEMTSQAKPDQTSLLLSNHSYGTVSGWNNGSWLGDPTISTQTDYKFGFYDIQSAQWDGISFNAPYYLIVKSAGNDRGESGDGSRPPDGAPDGYDCVPTFGVAKNILTVGAVNKVTNYTGPADVLMTSFSGWGPTDDGRIKPDIVAPGLNVLSSFALTTTSYSSISGTSMSTPAVTGVLALWQQLYKNLNSGNYMRSATLKALTIHSAREAGPNNGPDYAFGWGLLDAEGGAKVIIDKDNQNTFIREAVLVSGQVFELNLGVPKAGTKIMATLVWTDPAGSPPPPSLNPTAKMLVNDLDLRLVDDAGAQQFPWTLSPSNPASAALKTVDNFRDNVEKIEFNNPQPRIYKLRITNKGNLLGGSQAFSLILTYSSQVDPRITYYWIGNGGSWNDGTHWSLSSGGPSANTIPGVEDRVVFDESSFTQDNETITMSTDRSCYSLRWFAQEPVDISMSGDTLTVAESLTFLSNSLVTSTAGVLKFTGSGSAENTVDLGASMLGKWSLIFKGNSSWALTGTAAVDWVRVLKGKLKFDKSALRLNYLLTPGTAAKTVSFASASLRGNQKLSLDFTSAILESDSISSIVILPSLLQVISFAVASFQGFVNVQSGEVSIMSGAAVRSIQGNGIVSLSGGMVVSNLSLSGGSQLVLQDGGVQTFTDKMVFSTSATSRVTIKSSGPGKATMALNGYYKLCFDHVDVQKVDLSGNSAVTVGAGGTLSNALNWLNISCGTILFPDFSIAYSCANASLYFTDKSSGPISSRLWNFGHPASPDNTSTLTNPIHYFGAGGPFTVSLQVTGAGGPKSSSRPVTLGANILPVNSVQVNNGKLISTTVASGYQWLKNGLVVPDEIARTFSATASGEYSVLIFDATCNRRSEPFVITGLNDDLMTVGRKITIYPIPTSDFLQVESVEGILAVSILDAVGRESVLDMELIRESLYRLNVTSVPSGLYILKVTLEGKTELRKVIIRK